MGLSLELARARQRIKELEAELAEKPFLDRQEVIAKIVAEADAWVKRGEELTVNQAIAYLSWLIKIHETYIKMITDDVNITGSDEWHRLWMWRYSQMIVLINKINK